MALANGLLLSQVAHARLFPKRHAFRYNVYYLTFRLSEMKKLKTKLLSLARFNLFSFYERDYGIGEFCGESWARKTLADWNITKADGEIVLMTMPRIFGYGFNPVSFWFCLDLGGALRAVISEVRNTFGERHAYLSYHDDQHIITSDDTLTAKKVFHVSPYFLIEGYYTFRFHYSEEKIAVWIDFYKEQTKMLTTSVIGTRSMLTDKTLLSAFLHCPLLTFKVITLIHYHALRLTIKGIRYHVKPPPPKEDISR